MGGQKVLDLGGKGVRVDGLLEPAFGSRGQAFFRSPTIEQEITVMMGMALVRVSALSAGATACASMPGNWMSSRISAGWR